MEKHKLKYMEMSYFLLFLIYIFSVMVNIEGLFFATEASRAGTCCTAVYILAWIVIFVWNPSIPFKQILLFYWFTTGILALLLLMGDYFHGWDLSLLAPCIVILITPLYGMNIQGVTPVMFKMAVLLISVLICVCCLVRVRRKVRDQWP